MHILATIGRITAWLLISLLIGALIDPLFPTLPRSDSRALLEVVQVAWVAGCAIAGWFISGIPGYVHRGRLNRIGDVSLIRRTDDARFIE